MCCIADRTKASVLMSLRSLVQIRGITLTLQESVCVLNINLNPPGASSSKVVSEHVLLWTCLLSKIEEVRKKRGLNRKSEEGVEK